MPLAAFWAFRTYVARFWRPFPRLVCVGPPLTQFLLAYLRFFLEHPVVPNKSGYERSARSDDMTQRAAMGDDTTAA